MLKLESGTFLGFKRQSLDAEGVIISRTEYQRTVYEGWHCHQNSHLTLILDGGNREQRSHAELQALPGTVLLYNAEERHRNRHTVHPSKNLNLELDPTFFAAYHTAPLSFAQAVCPHPDAKFALLKIYHECLAPDADSVATIHSLLLALLSSYSNHEQRNAPPPWARTLRELLHDCWNEPLPLQQLSRRLGIHPVSISKGFARYFGTTLGEYQRKLKVERALHLIRQPQYPLTQIAYECGFFDQSHFVRTFKRVTGWRPNEYRRL